MKILVIGWYYDSNLGDGVICECTAAMLRRRYPHGQILLRDIACREAFRRSDRCTGKGIRAQRRRHLLRIAATRLGWDKVLSRETYLLSRKQAGLEALAAEDWDMVVFAGGQLFMDGLGLYVQTLTESFARRNIPVFFNACGVGPSWSKIIQARLGRALCLENVKYLSCRDDVDRLNRWCGKPAAVPAADPALWAAEVYGIRKSAGAETVGLGIMFANSLPPGRVLAFWRRLIRCLQRRGTPWKLFTNGAEADMCFARELLRSLDLAEEACLCPAPRIPEELVQQTAGFGSIISFRLHSHIIAASLDIPSVALEWDSKLPAFFEKLGRPERCLTIDTPPEGVLAALVRARLEGLDRHALEQQRENAARQLFAAMDGIPQ